MSVKLGINGFGRIGRLVFRAAINNPDVEVVAVNDLTDSTTMAHLLQYDSVHGKLDFDVIAKEDTIEVSGKSFAITSIKDPASLKWKEVTESSLFIVLVIISSTRNDGSGSSS